jgi:uncharacterized protein YuzE
MHLTYDKEVDAAYLYLKDEGIADHEVDKSEETAPGVIYDFDSHNNLIGIEVTSIQGRGSDLVQYVSPVLTEEQRQKVRELYREKIPA